MSAQLLQRLGAQLQQMAVYERPDLQHKALAAIPVDELRRRAEEHSADSPYSSQDCLLRELLAWFKQDFFKWVNTLKCERCDGDTENAGMLQPSADDQRYGAGRVEAHKCKTCQHITRFPRYNDPGKLLESRRGRCGEWANCFVLCCRAMGFETRYVLDFTDHVWAEVYSDQEKRWLHCDPCENRCDTPLMYESGWGKKLSYIFAFTTYEVADVLWKYSLKHDEVLQRRNQCSEGALAQALAAINRGLQRQLPAERQQVVLDRTLDELVSLFDKQLKSLSAEELMGRQSGSEAWRRARGELGPDGQQQAQSAAPAENPWEGL